MSAPKGNQFWKLASKKHGRKPKWEDPEELLEACEEYFDSVVSEPLIEDGTFAYQGEVTHEPIAKMRTMSIEGLCVFLGITRPTWKSYCEREEFLSVTGYVSNVMWDYKVSGAAAGLLNPNIIARDLGLKDKSETDVTTQGQSLNLTEVERKAKIAALLAKGKANNNES